MYLNGFWLVWIFMCLVSFVVEIKVILYWLYLKGLLIIFISLFILRLGLVLFNFLLFLVEVILLLVMVICVILSFCFKFNVWLEILFCVEGCLLFRVICFLWVFELGNVVVWFVLLWRRELWSFLWIVSLDEVLKVII